VILYPAIDIRGGHAVRLVQGDYARETVFDADPLDAAKRWVEQGAEWLHVVDLDGAREGRPVNLDAVERIAVQAGAPVQMGGGLRDAGSVAAALEAGVERVVIGTRAQSDPDFVGELVEAHGARAIVVALDAREGRIAVKGWTEPTTTPVDMLEIEVSTHGVRRYIFTPVEVDGTLAGPPLDQVRDLARSIEGELIYSGGIGTLDDLRALAHLDQPNLQGAIVGRALYEGHFTVGQARAALTG